MEGYRKDLELASEMMLKKKSGIAIYMDFFISHLIKGRDVEYYFSFDIKKFLNVVDV